MEDTNDPGCQDSAGVDTFNIHARANWVLQIHVGNQGDVLNPDSHFPCLSVADDSLDDGNTADGSFLRHFSFREDI